MGGQKGGLWVWSSVSGDDFGLWKFLSTFFCQKLKGGEGKRWIVGLCDFSISLFLFIFRFFIIPEKNSGKGIARRAGRQFDFYISPKDLQRTAAFSFCYPLRNEKRGETDRQREEEALDPYGLLLLLLLLHGFLLSLIRR